MGALLSITRNLGQQFDAVPRVTIKLIVESLGRVSQLPAVRAFSEIERMNTIVVRIGGSVLLAIILWDTFEVILLPIPVKRNIRLIKLFLSALWSVWRSFGKALRSGQRREQLLGLFGPMSLMLLIVVWILGLIFGFGLLRMSLSQTPTSLLHNLYVSGATFFTLGSDNPLPASLGLKLI